MEILLYFKIRIKTIVIIFQVAICTQSRSGLPLNFGSPDVEISWPRDVGAVDFSNPVFASEARFTVLRVS